MRTPTNRNMDVNDWGGLTKLNSTTIRYELPVGTATIIIAEFEPGIVARVWMQVGKAGSEINAQIGSLCELVTVMLREGKSITQVVSHLTGHSSDRTAYLKGGVQARSTSEALALALQTYRNSVPQVMLDDGRRPARIAK